MNDAVYCYAPDYVAFKKKAGLKDADQLDRFGRRAVIQRLTEGVHEGYFGLAQLRAIHRHLFQDVYDCTGELRTVEIVRDGGQFSVPLLHRHRHGRGAPPPRCPHLSENLMP